jgi:hypothetical protein
LELRHPETMSDTPAMRSAGLNKEDLKKERAVYLRQVTTKHAMYYKRVFMSEEDRCFLADLANKLQERVRVASWKSSSTKIRLQNVNFLKVVRLRDCDRLYQLAWEQRLMDSDKQFIMSLVDCEGALCIKDAAYARGLLRAQSVEDSQYAGFMHRLDARKRELHNDEIVEFGSVDWWGRKKQTAWLRTDNFIQTIQSALVGSLPPSPGSLLVQEAVGLEEAHALVDSLHRLERKKLTEVCRVCTEIQNADAVAEADCCGPVARRRCAHGARASGSVPAGRRGAQT